MVLSMNGPGRREAIGWVIISDPVDAPGFRAVTAGEAEPWTGSGDIPTAAGHPDGRGDERWSSWGCRLPGSSRDARAMRTPT